MSPNMGVGNGVVISANGGILPGVFERTELRGVSPSAGVLSLTRIPSIYFDFPRLAAVIS
jgi:hypothetical protein